MIGTENAALVNFLQVSIGYRWLVLYFCLSVFLQLHTFSGETLLASLNSSSFIMSTPRTALKCLLSPNLNVFRLPIE